MGAKKQNRQNKGDTEVTIFTAAFKRTSNPPKKCAFLSFSSEDKIQARNEQHETSALGLSDSRLASVGSLLFSTAWALYCSCLSESDSYVCALEELPAVITFTIKM